MVDHHTICSTLFVLDAWRVWGWPLCILCAKLSMGPMEAVFWCNTLSTLRPAPWLCWAWCQQCWQNVTQNETWCGQCCVGVSISFQCGGHMPRFPRPNRFDFCAKTTHHRAVLHIKFNDYPFSVASTELDARQKTASSATLLANWCGQHCIGSTWLSVDKWGAKRWASDVQIHDAAPDVHRFSPSVDRAQVVNK